jgi:exodeoxyribonuclease VII large subunit
MPASPDLDPRPAGPARDIYTVSRLNREARGLLEAALPSLWITGELSNLSRPASGHWYFSLKDEGAQVRCAMFRQRNLAVRAAPRDGMQVLLRARVGLYEARGEFQLIVDHLEEAGEGELRRRFEALKQKLAAEGLFDAARKRPAPRFPRRIGVVTSPTGAALRDVLHVLGRRFPAVPVLLYPVPVQGAGAAREIAAMLATADRRRDADVLLLVRGGGSLEDLWAFNDEGLARTIAGLGLPLICGVGHEVDFTIADFVADVRAPTPSAAAELAVPDAAACRDALAVTAGRLRIAASRSAQRRREALREAARRLARLHPAQFVRERMQRLDELQARALAAVLRERRSRGERLLRLGAELAAASPARRLSSLRQRSAQAARRLAPSLAQNVAQAGLRLQSALRALHATSPIATLERGYAIVNRATDGALVRDPQQAPPGTDLDVRIAGGRLQARVLGARG